MISDHPTEMADREEPARVDESDELAHLPPAVERVEAAQRRLASLEGQPVTAHIETYEGVHIALRDALAELDEA